MMDRCAFCGNALHEHEYRYRFDIHLPKELHGESLTIDARTIEVTCHPKCAIISGRELALEASQLIGPQAAQDNFKDSFDNWFDSLTGR